MADVATQARYEAAEHGEDGDDSEYPMFVYDGPEHDVPSGRVSRETGKVFRTRDYLGPKFTRAQAEIIAFALNAIAEGLCLVASRRIEGTTAHEEIREYVGSTDGVRP